MRYTVRGLYFKPRYLFRQMKQKKKGRDADMHISLFELTCATQMCLTHI